MLEVKSYSHKLPTIVRKAMQNFTNEDCVLVKKRQKGKTSNNTENNCHDNVNYWVNKIGGEIQNGWLLVRNRRLIKMGVWVWNYHSVWKTPESKLADVTANDEYATNHFTTVWLDNNRTVDLKNGIGYNNLIIFDNQKAIDLWNNEYKLDLKVGELYWVSDCLRYFKKLVEHNGQYLWLHEEYADNRKKFQMEIKQYESVEDFPIDILFDYSLGIH
jgi:hypothetical protein